MTNDDLINARMNEQINQLRELLGLHSAALAGTEPAGLNVSRPTAETYNVFAQSRMSGSGSLEAIGEAVMRVRGVDSCSTSYPTPGHAHVEVRGGDRFEVWKAINDARPFGASFDLIHDGVAICPYNPRQQPLRSTSVAPRGLAACVVKTPDPVCPECHGRGEVELFWSVSPCSRGCSR